MPEPTSSGPDRSSSVGLPSGISWAKADRLIHLNLHVEDAAQETALPFNYHAFPKIAVDVFKTRNLDAIQSLKKFLTALPSPSYVREALLQAIYQLAEQDSGTYQWILRHHHHLEPELSLTNIAQQIAIEQLQSQGLAINRDFSFTADGKLEAIESVKTALLRRTSISDCLLLKEVLFTDLST